MRILNRRVCLKSSVGWSTGWLWVVALLALPNCSFDVHGLAPIPHTTAVFCDIQKPLPDGRHCATTLEERGIRLADAAVALYNGDNMDVALDDSPTARAACPGSVPQAVEFQGAFPVGLGGCAVPSTLTDLNAFCATQCEGLFPDPADPTVVAFCTANARPSTNVPIAPDLGFPAGCTDEGTVRMDFADPRQLPEPVVWGDLDGVIATGASLMRNRATTGTTTADFNAGAVSTHWISRGDAYVEFSAAEVDKSHVVGLSEIPGGCPPPCTDSDPSLADINFGISLNGDGRFYIIEGGALVTGPDLNGSYGTYTVGERFRVSLTQSDSPDTATVIYSRLTGSCIPGHHCPETTIFTHLGLGRYPLRVDTSFREKDASVSNVSVVRIQR